MQNRYYNVPSYITFGNTYFKDNFCQEELNNNKRRENVLCLLWNIFWPMKES